MVDEEKVHIIASPVKLSSKQSQQFYFEEEELRVPADFEPTSAATTAGFHEFHRGHTQEVVSHQIESQF
jgi:hypothetical protein